MYKLSLVLAADILALITGIFVTENSVPIDGSGNHILALTEQFATKSELIVWLCVVLASVSLGLTLQRWMRINGHQKWEVILWPLVLTVVILLGSCSIAGRSSPPVVETHHPTDLGRGAPHQSGAIPGQMLAGARKKNALLNGTNFQKAMLAGADLRGSDLESADLRGAMLLGTNLSGTNLTNVNFEGAMLLGTHMEGARIDGADFSGAAFLSQEQIDETCGNPRVLPQGLRAPRPCN